MQFAASQAGPNIEIMSKISKIFWGVLFLHYSAIVNGQVRVTGRVFDETGIYPVESVSVLSNSKTGAVTGKSGKYEIILPLDDSVWFSYLGKTTQKFYVKDIIIQPSFDISIKIPAPVLPEVRVVSNNYRLDSINNRLEYQKIFDYKNPSFRSVFKSVSLTGFVIDIDELIRLFQFKKKKNLSGFRNRLISEEQKKFIEKKFNKVVIREVVDIAEEEIPEFISLYSPGYYFASTATEYEMKEYIKESYQLYKKRL